MRIKTRSIWNGLAIICAMLAVTSLSARGEDQPDTGNSQNVNNYQEMVESYGDNVTGYIYQADAAGEITDVVVGNGGKAYVYTDTNIREGASDQTTSLTVIPDGTTVLIWGYTQNGWTKVFCKSQETQSEEEMPVYEGYIKSDLLINE